MSGSYTAGRRGCNVVALVIFLLQGCGGDDGPAAPPPPAASLSAPTLPGVPASVPLRVDAFEPAIAREGDVIALRGSGFTRDTKVRWGNELFNAKFESATGITFELPRNDLDADVTGTVEAVREDGAKAAASTSLTLEAVPTVTSMDKSDVEAGDVVRISGRGLQRVTQVDMTGTNATVSDAASDGTWLDVVVPEDASDGAIELWDARKRSYSAGHVAVRKPSLPLTIDDVQIGQTHLYSVGRGQKYPYMRLVSGKPTLVTVRLKGAPGAGKLWPRVRLGVANDFSGTRWFEMKGPAMLGAGAVAANDFANNYTLELDSSWMQRGFKLGVEAHDRRSPSKVSRVSYMAGTGIHPRTFMRVHVVNLVPDGTRPIAPDFAVLERALREQFPLSDVQFVRHPRQVRLAGKPFLGNEEEWLMALEKERVASAGAFSDFFVGFSPTLGSGLAFMPGRSAVMPAQWISATGDHPENVMMHELGHNLGRDHTWEDPRFPYWRNGVRATQPFEEGALAGGPWRFTRSGLFNPLAYHDIMSYNQPMSIADYTYAGVLSLMPAQIRPSSAFLAPVAPGAVACEASACADSATMAIHVSGAINDNNGTALLDPLVAMPVASETVPLIASAPRGSAELEVRASTGTYRFALQLARVDHAMPGHSTVFSATIPAMRGIESVRVVHEGKTLATMLAAPESGVTVPAATAPDAAAVRTAWGSYRIDGRTLRLQWDARRYPWSSAWARVDGRMVPIAVAQVGGALDGEADARATEYIVTFSDGLNNEVHRISR